MTDMARGPTKFKVFICYSRKDMAFVDRLEAALSARGFEPLVDRRDIALGDDWLRYTEELMSSGTQHGPPIGVQS